MKGQEVNLKTVRLKAYTVNVETSPKIVFFKVTP